jgi:hypothetical protein
MMTATANVNSMTLEMSPDRALFEGKVQGLVATCYQNERPLSGLAGLLDWRFQGAISNCLRIGAFSGEPGECVYLPVTRNERTYHLILAGCGYTSAHGSRVHVPPETLTLLRKNLASLRIPQIGVSRGDFGNATHEYFAKNLKGVPLWITP